MVAACLAAATLYVGWPLFPAIILGAWLGMLARPFATWLKRHVGGRGRAAAGATTLIVLAILLPLTGIIVLVVSAGIDLWTDIRNWPPGRGALEALVTQPGSDQVTSPSRMLELARQYAPQTWNLAMTLLQGVSTAALRLLVVLVVTYTRLAHGHETYEWIARRSPLPRADFERLTNAFDETGRALIIGMGLTAMLQGAVAAVAFTALGVPRALTLGGVTVIAAFIPVVGTALVWAPVAAGLALSGRLVAGLVMFAIGAGVIGMLDNIVRPVLTRRARSRLPATMLMIAMLGGLATLGFPGILLGPLVVRLAIETLDIAQEERAREPEANSQR